MTANDSTRYFIGSATEQGPRRPRNADGFAVHQFHERLALAVLDGTGSDPAVAEFAQLGAGVAVRIGARKSATAGVLAAADLTADPSLEFPTPDGAIIVAVTEPGQSWHIAWAGDCVAYSWNGRECRQVTTPHTNGQRLRESGADEATARAHDHEIWHSVGRATADNVSTIEVESPYLVLSSDGLKLTETEIAEILTIHQEDLDTCARELIAKARTNSADDITVLIVSQSGDLH